MAKKKKKQKAYNPAIDDGTSRPIRAAVAIGDPQDKYSEYPSSGLSPRRLAEIFREADEGNVLRQMELFEEMEEKDTHLFSQLQTRKLAVTGLDWEVQPFSEEERDVAVAEFIDDQLHGLESLNDVLLDILDAVGKGISLSEITWGVDSQGRNVVEDITWVHPKKIFWDSIDDEIKITTREYPQGIPLPENKFIVHKYKAKSGHPSRAGVLRIVSWMYLFKNYDLKDWVSFCEVFGMPLRLGKYDASASDADKAALMEAIIQLGTDAAGIVPSTTTIEFIESNKQSSAEIYEKLARYCDEQMSKAVLGQTLTSDSGSGSYAQSKTHNEVRKDLTAADANALENTLRRDLIRPLVEFNFGPGTPIPTLQFQTEDADDLKETSEIYRTLACDMGLEIPKSHLYKKFGIPKPERGEPVTQHQLPVGVPGPEVQLKLKASEKTDPQPYIDGLVEESAKKGSEIFTQLLQPVLNIIDKTDSLEALQLQLKDKEQLKQLYQQMDGGELKELLAQGIYVANLIGRTAEDG
nr:MAG TPA: portal [Caudoviricetes sp.]